MFTQIFPKCSPPCFPEGKAKDLCIPQAVSEGISWALAAMQTKPHSRMSICLVNHGILRLTRCHFVYSRARPNCWRRPWQCWTVRGKAGKTNERESWLRESRCSSCPACLCRIYRYQLCGEESTQITHRMQSSNPWIKHMRQKINTSYLHLTSPCRIFAKSCTKRLMWWMRSATTLTPKWLKITWR